MTSSRSMSSTSLCFLSENGSGIGTWSGISRGGDAGRGLVVRREALPGEKDDEVGVVSLSRGVWVLTGVDDRPCLDATVADLLK